MGRRGVELNSDRVLNEDQAHREINEQLQRLQTIAEGSDFTQIQADNIVGHMLVAALNERVTGMEFRGALGIVMKSGEVIAEYHPEVGRIITYLGRVLYLNSPYSALKSFAQGKGVFPHVQPEDECIYSWFESYNKGIDPTLGYNWLLNIPPNPPKL